MKIVNRSAIPQQTDPVSKDELVEAYRLCTQMAAICRDHEGVGLSAAQIGSSLKLFVIDQGGKFRYFANCEYEPTSDKQVPQIEGCLSLPQRIFRTKRWEEVDVKGDELILDDGKPTLKEFTHTTKEIVYQHEIDHQNGILISDHGRQVFCRPMT